MSSWTGAKPTAGLHRGDLEKRVSDLEKQIAELMKVIKLTGGSVSIESTGMVHIKGAGSVSIESGGGMAIRTGATLDLQGAVVRLNGGTHPVARSGDITLPNSSVIVPLIIGPGCPTVLA
jgi:hypothetical protein